jgi:radical SAM superfamily enzyme YgiQ (UPF0313 family)
MRVALVSLYGVENVGIRSLSSVLKENGHEVFLIFLKRWLNNDITLLSEKEKKCLVSLLRELNVEILGFSFTSPFFKIAKELTLRVKRNLDIPIIWGGIHATVLPQECLKYCDFVCRGEGEYALLKFIEAIDKKKSIKGIKNFSYIENGKIVNEPLRPLIQDLDSLPYPDYEKDNKFYIDKKIYLMDPLSQARELRVFASRGCPFNCSYCYNSIFRQLYPGQRYYRTKSVFRVISEIEHALNNLSQIRKIKFDDDTFIFPEAWIDEFAKRYKREVGLPFEILFNVQCLNKNILRKLKIAGLKRIQVGLQTASERESKEVYNRALDKQKVREFAWLAKRLRIDTVYDIILDDPLSNFSEKKELIEFLLTLPKPFNLFLYSLTIFPGTKLCKDLLEKGIIREKDIEGNANKSFYQFRFSFSYPRSKEELFAACLISLTSKRFMPLKLILLILESKFFKKHPFLIRKIAEILNLIKLFYIGIRMYLEGSLNIWKLGEYGLPRRLLIQ